MAAEKFAEVRNDLQTLNGRANFSIGYRFARITTACCHRCPGVCRGTHAVGSKMRMWREYEIPRNPMSISDVCIIYLLYMFFYIRVLSVLLVGHQSRFGNLVLMMVFGCFLVVLYAWQRGPAIPKGKLALMPGKQEPV